MDVPRKKSYVKSAPRRALAMAWDQGLDASISPVFRASAFSVTERGVFWSDDRTGNRSRHTSPIHRVAFARHAPTVSAVQLGLAEGFRLGIVTLLRAALGALSPGAARGPPETGSKPGTR
jgi:hypothetical protein